MNDLLGKQVVFSISSRDGLSGEMKPETYYGTLEKIEGTMIFLKNNTLSPEKQDKLFDVWVNTTSLFFFWIKKAD